MAHTGRGPGRSLLLWTAVTLLFVLAKHATWRDPHFWDALGCYVAQARFIARHGLDLGAYPALVFLRPPLFTGLLAAAIRLGGDTPLTLHLITCAIGALTLPATYLICRRLGGERACAALAAALCAATPLFFAQAGLVQSDLPATALCAWAWALLLSGRTAAFVVLTSLAVLTKESAYFLCAPAALLLLMRAPRGRSPLSARALVPAALPGVVLCAWELAHRLIMGSVFSPIYADNFGPRHLPNAFMHQFIEGGRPLLLVAAGLAVAPALRDRGAPARAEVLATALCVLILPFCFPASLPRYMLLALPQLCALAALGLFRLRGPRRVGAAAVLLGALLALFQERSIHGNMGFHLERNMAYRGLLQVQAQAAQEIAIAIAAAGPGKLVATFPMAEVLSSAPGDGYLPAPLHVTAAEPDVSARALCGHDLLVDDCQGMSMGPALDALRRAGALVPWRRFGAGDQEIRVYRIDRSRCP